MGRSFGIAPRKARITEIPTEGVSPQLQACYQDAQFGYSHFPLVYDASLRPKLDCNSLSAQRIGTFS